MPKIDWLRMIGLTNGGNGEKGGGGGGGSSLAGALTSANGENTGNALAQLFGGGKGKDGMFSSVSSVFGSGLDDGPKARRK